MAELAEGPATNCGRQRQRSLLTDPCAPPEVADESPRRQVDIAPVELRPSWRQAAVIAGLFVACSGVLALVLPRFARY